jgi:hypothetical protein
MLERELGLNLTAKPWPGTPSGKVRSASMQFSLHYRLGDAPQTSDIREFPDAGAAKAHARQSLEETLTASSADTASITVAEVQNDGGEVICLGAYSAARGGEPVWREAS